MLGQGGKVVRRSPVEISKRRYQSTGVPLEVEVKKLQKDLDANFGQTRGLSKEVKASNASLDKIGQRLDIAEKHIFSTKPTTIVEAEEGFGDGFAKEVESYIPNTPAKAGKVAASQLLALLAVLLVAAVDGDELMEKLKKVAQGEAKQLEKEIAEYRAEIEKSELAAAAKKKVLADLAKENEDWSAYLADVFHGKTARVELDLKSISADISVYEEKIAMAQEKIADLDRALSKIQDQIYIHID